MNKRNSIIQIARDANCSTATISRYFNGGYVSQEMKAKIKNSIIKLNYTLSPIAKLMRGQSDEVYVICSAKESSVNNNIIPFFVQQKKIDTVFFSYFNYESPNYFKGLINIINRNPKAIVIINHSNDKMFFEFIVKHQKETNFFILGGKGDFLWNEFNFPFYYINERKVFEKLVSKMIKNKNNVCYLGINYKIASNDLWYYHERFLAFKNSSKNFKNKKNYVLLKNNSVEEAAKEFIKMTKKGYTNFICSTHTIYRAFCEVFKKNNFSNDIGYWSLSDAQKNFKLKLFIPFDEIANDIIDDIEKNAFSKIVRNYYPIII